MHTVQQEVVRCKDVYLKADFFELSLDVFHQTHVPAVDKVLSTPLLYQQTHTGLYSSSALT